MTEGEIARELPFVALGLGGLTAFMLLLSDGAVLFSRPLWTDEVFTVLVSGQSSPVDVIADLSRGADGGAGLVHLSVWAVQKIVGIPSPTLLRTLSLVCVFAALCLVYAVLRRRFSSSASIAGVLAVGSHYLVVTHAFEARFYGPWLLCCALFALALSRNQAATASRRTAAIVAVAGILLCTVHFYGVISLVLMAGGVIASYGGRWREGVRVVVPSAAGLLAVLAIVPLAVGMRNAFSVRSWVPEFEFSQVVALGYQFWFARVLQLAAVALAAGIILSWGGIASRSVTSIVRHAARDAGNVALASLILVPLALTAVTLAGQPAMLFRYSIATALAWGPLVALSMELLGRWPARVAWIVLVAFWFHSFVTITDEKSVFAADVEETEAAVRGVEGTGLPVVFQSMHAWYPLWARDRSRGASLAFLELSDSTLGKFVRSGTRNERFNRGLVIDRDVVRIHAKRYGIPRLVSQATLDSMPRFVLIAAWGHLPMGHKSIERFSRLAFPHHRVQQIDLNSALLERLPEAR